MKSLTCWGGAHKLNSLSTLVQKMYPSVVQKNDSHFEPTHQPVLLKETLEVLDLKEGMVVVDCTLGLAGHSTRMLQAVGQKGFLYAFDLDERNISVALPKLEAVGRNFRVFHDSFSSLKDRLRREGVFTGRRQGKLGVVDAVLFDLGLSSPHLDDSSRGFSFQKDGPLDMRFDASQGQTAADLLNSLPEAELADIFYLYGEERRSRRLAKAVVEARKKERFATTLQFAELVEDVLDKDAKARIFQSLRIAVNEELKALELGLNQAIELLAPHGRVVVLSYHSLEDRFVKHLFKQLASDLCDPTDPYGRRVLSTKSLSLLTKKPITATPEEVAKNPRARSVRLRAAEKL